MQIPFPFFYIFVFDLFINQHMNIKSLLITLGLAVPSIASAYDYSNYSPAFSANDYREALNMGLKFFGGQRCGNTHNWMLHDNKSVSDNYCHIKDGKGKVNGGANGDYDLTGGWHDCGDHIKVGTTMGYAAVSLLVAYDIWPEAFQDNYDGEYGGKNGIADVLDEVKIATDYFMKCFPDANSFVYYVGFEGDHNMWVTSSTQSKQTVENGGDPRPVWITSENGGPQAANYATALALMAMHYPDAKYREQCAKYAKIAYAYAEAHKFKHASIPIFYSNPNEEWTDELSLASIMMYNLTGDESYKKNAVLFLQNKWESNSPLAWDTMADFAYYYIIKANPNAGNGQGGYFKDFLMKNAFSLHISTAEKDSNGFPYYQSKWGTNKLACGGAAAASLYKKLVDDGVITTTENVTKIENFDNRIIDYVLGKNEFNHTFLHGYKDDMTFRIHHRNAMGRNDNPVQNVKNTCDFMFASGGLIGGPSGTGQFSNIIEGGASYTETEGGCDYNAPFVLAIAPLVAKMDPVDITETPLVEKTSFHVYPSETDDYIVVEPLVVNYQGKAVANVVSANGSVVLSAQIDDANPLVMNVSGLSRGVYVLNVDFNGGSKSYKFIKK